MTTILKVLEDQKDNLIVIFAGYEKQMEKFIKFNPGLKSRIGYTIKFDDYTNIGQRSVIGMGSHIVRSTNLAPNMISFGEPCREYKTISENYETLVKQPGREGKRTDDEIKHIAEVGPTKESLDKVKKYMLNKRAKDLKDNEYWIIWMDEYLRTGLNPLDNYEAVINSFTTKDVSNFIKTLIEQKNRVEVSMVSQKEDKTE